MKKIDFGQTLNTLANAGVIAGIIFLAIEVRQNQATLEEGNVMNQIAVENIAQEHFSHFRSLILENEQLLEVWEKGLSGAALSNSEQIRFNELCDEHIFRMFQTYRMRVRLDPATEYRGSPGLVRSFIDGSHAYAGCWARLRPALQSPDAFDFVEKVESNPN
jgi:hypothetical protein